MPAKLPAWSGLAERSGGRDAPNGKRNVVSESGLVKALGPRAVLWLAALVFLSTAALFAPAVRYGFVGLDDEPYVSQNPMTRDGLSIDSLKWAGTATVVGHWGPLLWLSYMLDGSLFGPGPAGFHATNVLLHAANALLVFLLLWRWTGALGAALWGALFWAWHPLRVESVAWITERKDVLSGLFFLLCAGSYVRGMRERSGWPMRIGLPAAFLAAGLAVKPVLVTMPFVLLLLDVWPLDRANRRTWPQRVLEKWPFWLLAAGFGSVSWLVNVGAGIPHADMPALADRLALIPGNYLTYLRQIVWPGTLAALYPRPRFLPGTFALGAATLAALTSLALAARRKNPGALAGWLWFLGMLVPSIGVVWMGTTEGAGDRFTYLPAIGLSAVVAATWAARRPGFRRLWMAVGAASLLAAALGTLRQLPTWRDSGTLYERILEVSPWHLQANLNRGLWLQEQGRLDDARAHYRRVLALAKGPETLAAAGQAWVFEGRAADARALLETVPDDSRQSPAMRAARGMACLHEGDAAGAVRHLEWALAREPAESGWRVELARALFAAGEPEQARAQAARVTNWPGAEIRAAGDLFPFYVQRWRDGARAYAWRYFEERAEERPDDVPLLNNVAWLAATDRGTPAELRASALEWARRAVRLTAGENATTLDTLAAALAANGDFAEAVGEAEKARAAALRAGDAELARGIARRAAEYRRGRAWRE